MTGLDERLDAAKKVADAVLYEGYVLYPYRASARKNQLRWQFGVLVPPAGAGPGSGEASAMRTEVVARAGEGTTFHVRVRALQVQARTVEAPDGRAGGFHAVASIDAGDRVWTSFDEAVEQEMDLAGMTLDELLAGGCALDIAWAASESIQAIVDRLGDVIGRVVRRRDPVRARIEVLAAHCGADDALVRLSIAVDNLTPGAAPASRDDAVRRSLVAVHTLAAVDGGTFLSVLDPPADAAAAAAACASEGTFPVLIADDVVLSSPIILYDHPAIAPESEGDMFDATEIDEILALRVMTLTDDEKREARGTDPRSAAVVDRCDAMTPEALDRLHGTFRPIATTGHTDGRDSHGRDSHGRDTEGLDRDGGDTDGADGALPWWEPAVDAAFDPWSDTVWIGAVQVTQGTRVVLRPSRRADAQDLFLAGLPATVAGVFHDVDGDVHLAVLVDGDAGSDLHESHGRYLYFHPDEVEIVGGAAARRDIEGR